MQRVAAPRNGPCVACGVKAKRRQVFEAEYSDEGYDLLKKAILEWHQTPLYHAKCEPKAQESAA